MANTATQLDIRPGDKRTAEEALDGPNKKTVKTNHNAIPKGNASMAPTAAKPMIKVRPIAASSSDPSGIHSSINKPPLPSKSPADPTPSQNAAQSNLEAVSKKEPKKGSYAEIMARAKANQAKPQAVGTINHKPKERGALTYKKELKLQKQAKRDKKLSTIGDKDGSHASSADEAPRTGQTRRKSANPKQGLPAKKPKPQLAYKGTMNPASVTARAKEKAAAQSARRGNEYAGTDEELDGDDQLDDDDGYGYAEEQESDDMEAGFSDVEQEETAADRAARKEDEEEARLEAKLKREKEERKRRVEELVKKAKPQRY